MRKKIRLKKSPNNAINDLLRARMLAREYLVARGAWLSRSEQTEDIDEERFQYFLRERRALEALLDLLTSEEDT